MSRAFDDLLTKAYRMEGLIQCARLAESNDAVPHLRKNGTGLAEILAVLADLSADLSGEIEQIGQAGGAA